nr:uncharacterized protein LOC110374230 isoform X2 [Helicoverpa armigera]
MEKLLFILFAAPWVMFAMAAETVNDTEMLTNSSDPNKDIGNQEAVTFYHTNGSQGLDLSKISSPLLTNVTAQSMVGVAPMPGNTENGGNQLPWSTLNHLANMSPQHATAGSEPMKPSKRSIRSIDIIDSNEDGPFDNLYRSLFKRDVSGEKTPVSIRSGSAVIPQGAHVQSIGIPPLLTLNNNMSNIPVPIPNTSVVHYSKINTLVTQP